MDVNSVHVKLLHLAGQLFQSLCAILFDEFHVQPKVLVFAALTAHLQAEQGFLCLGSFELNNGVHQVVLPVHLYAQMVIFYFLTVALQLLRKIKLAVNLNVSLIICHRVSSEIESQSLVWLVDLKLE